MTDWRAVWVAIEAGLFQHGDDAVAAGLPWLTERAKEQIARAAMRAAGAEAPPPKTRQGGVANGMSAH
jgi:hypothetical protein